MPSSFQLWYRRTQYISKVRKGYRLVPEGELEEKYIRCLQFLVQQGDEKAVGDYLEFGVFNGSSMSCMYRALQNVGLRDVRLFGFDSFQGLPEAAAYDDMGTWEPGTYAMSAQFARQFLSEQGVDLTRTYLIEGWFTDTLNDDTRKEYDLRGTGIVMIDCDIYSSARTALQFIAPLLNPTSLIVFDDWHSLDHSGVNLGEKKAFTEFLETHREYTAEPFDSYGKTGRIFLVERM